MRSMLGVMTVVSLAALAVGCFEIKQDTTLNPDGSGKAVVEYTMPDMPDMNMSPSGTPAAAPDPEVALKQFAKDTMDKSQGVEAWSDVSLKRQDDGRMTFKGTAYFKSIADFKVGQGQEKPLTWTKDEKGGVLTLKGPGGPEGPKTTPTPTMTDEQVAKLVEAAQAQYQQARPMMEMMLAKMKMEMTFRLPGKVSETAGFQKQADGSVKLAIEGAKMLAVQDEMMKDKAALAAEIKAGRSAGKNDAAVMEKLFGTKGDFTARVTGEMKPAFDYAAEAKAAKDAQPKMIEKLGLDKVPAKSGLSIGMPSMGAADKDPPTGAPPMKVEIKPAPKAVSTAAPAPTATK
jgi:hypothetical protein